MSELAKLRRRFRLLDLPGPTELSYRAGWLNSHDRVGSQSLRRSRCPCRVLWPEPARRVWRRRRPPPLDRGANRHEFDQTMADLGDVVLYTDDASTRMCSRPHPRGRPQPSARPRSRTPSGRRSALLRRRRIRNASSLCDCRSDRVATGQRKHKDHDQALQHILGARGQLHDLHERYQ